MILHIKKAHKNALEEYEKTKNKTEAKKILDEANTNYIFFKIPSTENTEDYAHILNNYAFYSIEQNPTLAITLLEQVLSLSPQRTVAHLNMAEALYELLHQKVIDQKAKEKLTDKIIYHYSLYKILSGNKIYDFEKFLSLNIINYGTRDICDFIKDYFAESIYGKPRIQEVYLKGFKIDINNDGQIDTILTKNNQKNEHTAVTILNGSKIKKIKKDDNIKDRLKGYSGFRFLNFEGKIYKVFHGDFVTIIDKDEEKIVCGCQRKNT
jgi:hypothetical protein